MNDLEKAVVEYQKAGNDWVDAKLASDQLDEDQKSFLAALINELAKSYDGRKVTEKNLERLALGSTQYRDYVVQVCRARAEMLRKKVRFDALGMLFESRRSQLSYEKEKLAKGIFHEGG